MDDFPIVAAGSRDEDVVWTELDTSRPSSSRIGEPCHRRRIDIPSLFECRMMRSIRQADRQRLCSDAVVAVLNLQHDVRRGWVHAQPGGISNTARRRPTMAEASSG